MPDPIGDRCLVPDNACARGYARQDSARRQRFQNAAAGCYAAPRFLKIYVVEVRRRSQCGNDCTPGMQRSRTQFCSSQSTTLIRDCRRTGNEHDRASHASLFEQLVRLSCLRKGKSLRDEWLNLLLIKEVEQGE
ncbi:MAG: hypothetical protein K0S28_1892 [Paucimonas sp.]|nr:hypothetical protein [Paucimonas sp.]